jgi:predicted nuclease of predicted toxin-antitoxin system
MRLYLDDNSCKGLLAILLRKAGHTVVVPSDVGCAGVSDPRHFLHAIQNNFVVLTKDYEDFLELHDIVQSTQGQHPGILAIRSDNDTSRDMKDRDIVRAIGNLERAGVPIANEFHVLNHWR